MAFLYNILPEYTRNTDTLTDNNISGEVKVLEEYLNVIDEEIFDILSNSIYEIMNFRDVYRIRLEYLPYFAYLLGYTWNSYVDHDVQRNLLSAILQLYTRKGTKFSFHFTLYNVSPEITIYEPYKDIFILNKSQLNKNHLSSRDYYSPGIIVLRVNSYNEHLFELFDMVKPAGWKIIVEGRFGLFYNIHLKPTTDFRSFYISDKYEITDPTNEEQLQYYSSIQYITSGSVLIAITMLGQTFMLDSTLTLNDLQLSSLLYESDDPDYGDKTLFRLSIQHSSNEVLTS